LPKTSGAKKMIKPCGVYRLNKKEKAKQKRVEALQVVAAVAVVLVLVYVTGLMPLI
jgi:hypothetical protein